MWINKTIIQLKPDKRYNGLIKESKLYKRILSKHFWQPLVDFGDQK